MKLCFLLAFMLTGCQNPNLTDEDRRLVTHQMVVMQAVTGGSIREPMIVWVDSTEFKYAGQTNCNDWTIILNTSVAAQDPLYMAQVIVPHEYAHIMSCHYRGGVGVDPHDEWWQEVVTRLGGDPEEV